MTDQSKEPDTSPEDLAKYRKALSGFSPTADATGADPAYPPVGERTERDHDDDPKGKE